jgi:hypothetical protein
MQAGTDLWEAAGWLGMTVEQLEQNYGHHHPDFQEEAAEAFDGRALDIPSVDDPCSAHSRRSPFNRGLALSECDYLDRSPGPAFHIPRT